MSNLYQNLALHTESDVEQKFLVQLLTYPEPNGLGYNSADYKTKIDIRKITIDKGAKKKLYYPDYAVIIDGMPLMIIEAKTPGEDLTEAMREARLYASEINSSYPKTLNPCQIVVATDGATILAGYWDQAEPAHIINVADMDAVNPSFALLLNFAAKKNLKKQADKLLSTIRSSARYFKPVHMLGGKTIGNQSVGDNSFGANVSIEYKYLFNPESFDDRASIVHNAYVPSKRKQAHIAPIDKLIRAALPLHVVDARPIGDSSKPKEIFDEIEDVRRIQNEICLLIGSVGSGKSTFTDYLRLEALPNSIIAGTEWINLNLNKAPLSKDLIYNWVVDHAIERIIENHPEYDFATIDILQKIYASQLTAINKGIASMYPKDSEKYIDLIVGEISKLQHDKIVTLKGIIDFIYGKTKLLVIVLDNCDKRNRDDQLLMFEVASWLKSEIRCMVFLPLRDTTYDQYRDEPPLDTVIKDLVFRIDPPLLEQVIYARLNYALREIANQNSKFTYHLPNAMRVECTRSEVGVYLKSMVSSLFQDQLFKRIISGLAGRNIRKGLEILLDFCKSGHITEDEILKIRISNGDYTIPNHLIALILFKGKRKYFSDRESHIKNLFDSDNEDVLPDPFVRIAILRWLKENKRVAGPNRSIGFHKLETLIGELQAAGHSGERTFQEVSKLIEAGCISAENLHSDIAMEDLITISPAGLIHLDLLKNINYLSAVSEDVFFRENQAAKEIKDNIIGAGKFKSDSRQAAISNAKVLSDYMLSYHERFFVGERMILNQDNQKDLIDLNELATFVDSKANNDIHYVSMYKLEMDYPVGSLVDAQIVSVQNYGLFANFGLDGYGLAHKSEILKGSKNIDDFEAGDWVTLEIMAFNPAHKRFNLKFPSIEISETQT